MRCGWRRLGRLHTDGDSGGHADRMSGSSVPPQFLARAASFTGLWLSEARQTEEGRPWRPRAPSLLAPSRTRIGLKCVVVAWSLLSEVSPHASPPIEEVVEAKHGQAYAHGHGHGHGQVPIREAPQLAAGSGAAMHALARVHDCVCLSGPLSISTFAPVPAPAPGPVPAPALVPVPAQVSVPVTVPGAGAGGKTP